MSFNVAIDGPAGAGKSTMPEQWQKRRALSMWIPEQCTAPWHCSC